MSRPNRTDADSPTFLGRWARRKAEARRAESAPAKPADKPAPGSPATVGPAQPPAAGATVPANEPAPIPPLESLDENADYARFMADDVGPELRRLALRKMFKAPVFNVRDGLDDYDEDFTTFTKLGSTLTADMKFHHDRLEQAAAQARDNASPDNSVGALASTANADPADTDDGAHAQAESGSPTGDPAAEPAQDTAAPATARPALALAPARPDEAAPPIMAGRPRGTLSAASPATATAPTKAPHGAAPDSNRKS